MSKRKAVQTGSKARSAKELERLAQEVSRWEKGELSPAGWTDAPAAIPHAAKSQAISIRLPATLLEILKRLAAREKIGYQVLIKRWLDDRLRLERTQLAHQPRETVGSRKSGLRLVRVTPDPKRHTV